MLSVEPLKPPTYGKKIEKYGETHKVIPYCNKMAKFSLRK